VEIAPVRGVHHRALDRPHGVSARRSCPNPSALGALGVSFGRPLMTGPARPGRRTGATLDEAVAVSDRQIMTAEEIRRAIVRISHEIVEKHGGTEGLAVVGIQRRGEPLAERLADAIGEHEGLRPPVGALDITFYRDDLSTIALHPVVKGSSLSFDLNGRTIVLVDDVLYTGRTVRAAMDELVDYGRPRAIRLAVLIDRGHRELPIRADHVGKNVPTSREETVKVHVAEIDAQDEVLIARLPRLVDAATGYTTEWGSEGGR
jgi:pyrimidine operon attenuation protein/uracil phosphoribosyltransferase